MRILQVCPYYLPSLGGIEVFVSRLSEFLVAEGHRVFVVCFAKKQDPTVQTMGGVEIRRIKPIATLSSQAITPNLSAKLEGIIRSVNPDVIHFHSPNPLLANALTKAMKHTGFSGHFYVHWHGDIVGRRLLKPWYEHSTRRLLQRADQISSDTQVYAIHSPFLKGFLDKVSVIPAIPDKEKLMCSGIDKTTKSTIDRESHGRFRLFSFGRFVKWKGFSLLIEAMNYLDDQKYVLFIAGYGKYERILRKLPQRDNVHFLGPVNDSEKLTLLTACDAFVFPSTGRQEAFGITLAEAMCLGKIPILFDKPDLGAREIAIPGQTAICPKHIDSRSLAQAIEFFSSMTEEEKRGFRSRIEETMESRCSKSIFQQRIKAFYHL